jgi:hypothetical protein
MVKVDRVPLGHVMTCVALLWFLRLGKLAVVRIRVTHFAAGVRIRELPNGFRIVGQLRAVARHTRLREVRAVQWKAGEIMVADAKSSGCESPFVVAALAARATRTCGKLSAVSVVVAVETHRVCE